MSDRLQNSLKRLTASWAGQLTKLAKDLAPAHLRPYIHSKVEDKDGVSFVVRTYVNRNENPIDKYGSADARAQEYGSGLRARRGSKTKYTIAPKNKPFLIFPWEVATQNPEHFVLTKDGNVVLPYVRHPGIKAANEGKGYIGPAQAEVRMRAKAQLGKEIRDVILGDLRESFSRSK